MKNKTPNKQAGFLSLIFSIIIFLIVIHLMGFTVSGFFSWVGAVLRSVF